MIFTHSLRFYRAVAPEQWHKSWGRSLAREEDADALSWAKNIQQQVDGNPAQRDIDPDRPEPAHETAMAGELLLPGKIKRGEGRGHDDGGERNVAEQHAVVENA